MIYEATFAANNEKRNIAGWDNPPKYINTFQIIKEMLETTDNTVVWIITLKQWDSWLVMYNKYFKEFLHYEMPYFVSNQWYPNEGRKLRLVVLKGKGKKND